MAEIYEVVNNISSNIYKALVTLNSGAFFALIHFWGKDGSAEILNRLFIHPAYLFAIGLTLVLLFAAADYSHGVFCKFQNKIFFCLCYLLALGSALFFLAGAWSIAYALTK